MSNTANLVEDACPVKRASPEMERVFPASNSSEALERRKAVESRLSKVSALDEMQFPEESSKQPAESAMPLSNEEVAPDVSCKEPPVILMPCDEENPAVERPPVRVDVPAPPNAKMPDGALRLPVEI